VISVDIRLALPSDAETVFRIQRTASLAAFAHIFPGDRHPFPDAEIRAEWQERLADPDVQTLLGQVRGKPVGYVAYAHEHLASLFVLPDIQGSGVGSALHDAALAAQADYGAEVCRLWVLSENREARTFYERRGWSPDGREQEAQFPPFPRELGYSIAITASEGQS
jgi:GNAT superfamily N-acetyltransferase